MNGDYVLILLVMLGILGRNNLVAASGCILLVLRLTGLDRFTYPWLERQGIETGLLFLMLYILVPYARGETSVDQLRATFTSRRGILAVLAGLLATRLNAQGLSLLQTMPETVFGMTMGAVVGIVFFDGVPCGPVMTAAVTTVLMEVGRWIGLGRLGGW
ncbi:MAG: DUF441 domain-containing protein [Peptococcaceae bacterium]|nr:DUF441 domain-containing protein [Peptococcaceae bacterium]